MAYIQCGRNTLRQIVKQANTKSSSSSDEAINPLLYACQGLRYRKLEVILTTSIEKLGKAGETVKVAPGHFRNHLMPKLLAVPNIDKFAYLIREQRKVPTLVPSSLLFGISVCALVVERPIYRQEEEEEVKVVEETVEDKHKEYETAANRLEKKVVSIRPQVNSKQFRTRVSKDAPIEITPVTKDRIVHEVARQLNVKLEPENLHLPSPLTAFGLFEVPIRFPKSIPLPEGKASRTLRVKIRG
ncbi:hypothetical protein Tsubulata_005009 [Turnera subulata]|uniref:Large ribosomal subunit protein bL9c n=1 Tax=Turnera subulata TaxID=218843 RepID=A0A9Q0J5A9_9ROSI|nr:hypothetical protein Tsubulata_005009 [Turnera subulata]